MLSSVMEILQMGDPSATVSTYSLDLQGQKSSWLLQHRLIYSNGSAF